MEKTQEGTPQDGKVNSKRIAKNMLVLYFRMIFQMVVFFYTSRALFAALGATDFGIYDAVGGFVIGLSFLNNAMANSTLRFITYAIGTNRPTEIQKVFSTSVNFHFVLALLIVIIGEPIGLWYMDHYMQLPPERMEAALWVFHCSLVAVFMMVLSVPYNTIIIAYERMTAFAYITMLDVSLKLAIVMSLTFWSGDNLITYALLIAGEAVLIRLVYTIYCRRHIPNAQYKWSKDCQLYKDMFSFASWSVFGNTSLVLNSQALNQLLNLLGGPIFGPLYNAARGLSVQVQAAITSFIYAFQTSINPQITKTYAQGNLETCNHLVLISARVSFCLTLVIVLPLMIECNFFLSVWVNNIPAHTVTFTQLLLGVSIIDALSNPLLIAADATGNIKRYQILTSLPLYLTLPLAYALYQITDNIESVFVALVLTTFIAQVVRMFICRGLYQFSIANYLREVIAKALMVSIASLPIPLLLKTLLPYGVWHSFLTAIITFLSTAVCIYIFGLRQQERNFVLDKVHNLCAKFF